MDSRTKQNPEGLESATGVSISRRCTGLAMTRELLGAALPLAVIVLLLFAGFASAQVVDETTLTNKIICGYQGWFACPGDGNSSGIGWNHWSKSSSDIGPGLPPSLRKCLVTTNIIESPNSGVRRQTRRVTDWEGGKMVRRWVASSFLSVEKGFRFQLWMGQAPR